MYTSGTGPLTITKLDKPRPGTGCGLDYYALAEGGYLVGTFETKAYAELWARYHSAYQIGPYAGQLVDRTVELVEEDAP
jgi:hypothetical protein